MTRIFFAALSLILALAGCARLSGKAQSSVENEKKGADILTGLQVKYAPDPHMAVYKVTAEAEGKRLVLQGEVDRVEAKVETIKAFETEGLQVVDQIQVLPTPEFADKGWAISCMSVATGREMPDHKAEMGTQVLMGHSVRLLKSTPHWVYAQSHNGYLSWLERGTIAQVTAAQRDAWENSPLLMVTAFDAQVREEPRADAQPVSDVVTGNLVKLTGEQGDWLKVQLPDERAGFLLKTAAQDYKSWKASRSPTPENIEQTGKMFLGRPYLWGGNSPKGMDCSGFAGTVFLLNGIELPRNASEQAVRGELVPTDKDLSGLRKGDLMFFGPGRRRGNPKWVTHVAIYLGEKLYIQSSERVRISSLDPASPIYDPYHGQSLLFARRILPQSTPQP